MPQHKSAIKRLRQSEKRRAHNRARKSRMRTLIKNVLTAENRADGELRLKEAVAYLDRMASKNILHRNNAARKKSRLTRFINNLG